MPTLFSIILLSSVVRPNFWWLLAITVLFGWMSLVGVVRAGFYVPVISTTSARAGGRRQRSQYHPASYVAKCHGRYPHFFYRLFYVVR